MGIYDEPLKWGETYFDRMTHEELLLHAKRMYSALQAADGVISQSVEMDKYHGESVYYSKRGVGGAAHERIQQTLDAITLRSDNYREDMYRSYFRYATDLLFQYNGYRHVNTGWKVCEQGHMTGNDHDSPIDACPHCRGSVRPLQWSDLDIQPV